MYYNNNDIISEKLVVWPAGPAIAVAVFVAGPGAQ